MCSSLQNAARGAPGTPRPPQPARTSMPFPHQEQLSVDCAAMPRIIVLEGDETGQELLDQALRVLDPEVLQVDLELEHFDLSLDSRRNTSNGVVNEAAEAMRAARFG